MVPTDVSRVSRALMDGDRRDAWDAIECIDGGFLPAGGRKVAGSNPVAPITRRTAWEATLKGSRSCRKAVLAGWRYQPWYQESSPHVLKGSPSSICVDSAGIRTFGEVGGGSEMPPVDDVGPEPCAYRRRHPSATLPQIRLRFNRQSSEVPPFTSIALTIQAFAVPGPGPEKTGKLSEIAIFPGAGSGLEPTAI